MIVRCFFASSADAVPVYHYPIFLSSGLYRCVIDSSLNESNLKSLQQTTSSQKLEMKFSWCFLLSLAAVGNAFNVAETGKTASRRDLIQGLAGFAAASVLSSALPDVASASGGATAGKYTTIPIAKRRYYGRVQAAVHDFLLIGPIVVKGDMSAPEIQDFFDPKGLVVVAARRQDVNGQCTKKNADCKGAEKRDSRYNDMKASMYLLGNAFRINQTKAPDNLPTVKAAKAFFKEMDAMEKKIKKAKAGDKDAIANYAAALDILDGYLDLVELPPIDSGYYEKEFSRSVGASSRLT